VAIPGRGREGHTQNFMADARNWNRRVCCRVTPSPCGLGGGCWWERQLAWLNFRWLGRGLKSFLDAVAGTEDLAERPGTARTYFTALFRYALIGVSVYVIFIYLHFPLVSIVLGCVRWEPRHLLQVCGK